MLTRTEMEKYAEVLLWGMETARTGRFKKGDVVLVRFDRPGIELAEIIQARLLEKGLQPVLRFMPTPVMEHNVFSLGNDKQVTFMPPGEEELYRNLHGNIYLDAPESITHLKDIDPRRIGKAAVARKPLRDILDRREEEGDFGWTLCMLPTAELARHAGMSEDEYGRQIVKACLLDEEDPVQAWKNIFKNAQKIKRWLNGMPVRTLHLESAHCDLEVKLGEQRRWIGVSGHNIPSFEIFVSPDGRGTRGVYYADQPSYRSGNLVKGVRLEFERGRAVKVDAEEGADFVRTQVAMDKGACRLGEFSLTDRRFSKIDAFMANTLFDENFGGPQGNCHVALGASYSDTYDGDPSDLTRETKKDLGFNDSALHWDLVNTEDKRVSATLKTGKTVTIYEHGEFAY